ncbi:hypothetical protein SUGI_0565730 [Cryptomeria japonica]|nr:hypothetical protein SUGI_0565730 [Cryptomeria japonica]
MPKPKMSTFKKRMIDEQTKKITSPLSVIVERPNKNPRKQLVEVLCIEGVETERNRFSGFDIFINYPDANSTIPFNNPHYAGSFASLGHIIMKGESMKGEFQDWDF